MRKISALAMAGVFAASLAGTAFAEMTDLKVSGEVRVRGESVTTDNTTPSNRSAYLQRTRLNVDAKANETTKAFIQLQDSRTWGGESLGDTNGDGIVDNNELTGTTGKTGMVDVSQAYVQLDQLFEQPLSIKIGRQAMVYGDQRLIGAFEWSNNARRFDAIKLMYNTDAVSVDLWTAKVSEGTTTSSTTGGDTDRDFTGLYVTVKTIPNNTIDVYALQDAAGADATNSLAAAAAQTDKARNVMTYGVRLNGKVADLDYTGEFALQSGDFGTIAATGVKKTQEASAYALKAGYTIPQAIGLRIGAEYDYASGDKTSTTDKTEAFQNLYPTNHPLYGYTDDVNWTNTKSLSVNLSAKPVKDLYVGLEYWMYSLAEQTAAGKDDNGTEINLLARYALNANVKLEAAYVARKAGSDIAAKDYSGRVIAKGDGSTFTYLQANVTF